MSDEAVAAGGRGLLTAVARHPASDLHLSTGARPFIRRDRALSFLSDHTLTAEDALRLNVALLSEGQRKIYLERKDFDYALALGAADRYRVNLMFHKNGAAGAYRMVPEAVRSMAELGYAAHLPTIQKLLSYHNGLILITGPVGSGKTTTLASVVDWLNAQRTDHIITVEDPIEVVQPAKGCNVSQREVGAHTRTFASALKGALREDPDIIVIGELRDLETIEMAISASETGHLVIGTMHTSDAATTLNRLLDVFPPAQQSQIRASVAESLRGVICQRLLPGAAGGLVLACEILVSNIAIQNLIKEGKSSGLRNSMETGSKEGMCLMDNVVFSLWEAREITAETALAIIDNRVLRAKILSALTGANDAREWVENGGPIVIAGFVKKWFHVVVTPPPTMDANSIYIVCLVVGLVFTIVSAFGSHFFAGHGEIGHFDSAHHEGSGGHAAGGDTSSNMPGFSPLSPTTIAAFVTSFGACGMIFSQFDATRSAWISAPLSIAGGLGDCHRVRGLSEQGVSGDPGIERGPHRRSRRGERHRDHPHRRRRRGRNRLRAIGEPLFRARPRRGQRDFRQRLDRENHPHRRHAILRLRRLNVPVPPKF